MMEGRSILYLEETDSTNTRLKELARKGARHGTVMRAAKQSGGRGRQGRSFESPGEGIYLSVLWRPDCSPEECLSLTPLAAVAVRRAVKSLSGINTDIKWPNDILLNGKKLCGILTETCISPEGIAVIVGIGLNVNCSVDSFSEELRSTVGSLYSESGKLWDIPALSAAIVAQLDSAYDEWCGNKVFFLEEYRENCLNIGKEVLVLRSGEGREGFALGINEDFSLRVRYSDGTEENISYGEVSLRNLRK